MLMRKVFERGNSDVIEMGESSSAIPDSDIDAERYFIAKLI